jgi:hypothetical protein
MTDEERVQTIKVATGVVAERLFPGGSLALKGDLQNAAIYAALGFAARAALGLPGLLFVSAASLSSALTGRHLHEVIGWNPLPRRQTPPAPQTQV